MGVMSTMPNRGTTRRNGARTGSVISLRIRTIGLPGAIGNQEISARAKIATHSTQTRMFAKYKK